jgi:hypothetical protein
MGFYDAHDAVNVIRHHHEIQCVCLIIPMLIMPVRRDRRFVQRCVALAAAVGTLWAQSGLPSTTIDLGLDRTTGTFVLRLPASVQAERCETQLLQTGAFGGISGVSSAKSERNTITIPTGARGKPARTLKAVVWCPGYAVGLIHEPTLEQSNGEIELALQPLPNIEITAKVLPAPSARNLTGLDVRVLYVANWVCGFFQLPDCWVPSWFVASAPIGIDGTLRLAVPDFSSDPGVRAYSFPGEFKLAIESGGYVLDVIDAAGGTSPGIGVSSRYPALITLQPRPR